MERKVFEELLELKRLQIQAGRANEQLLVKRLSDNYSKTLQDLVGLKNYDGPFTFKEFEKYLYSKYFQLFFKPPNLMFAHFLCVHSGNQILHVKTKVKSCLTSDHLCLTM